MNNRFVRAAAFTAAITLVSGTAFARSSTYESVGEDTCYASTYVPNLVEENTRGRLLRSAQPFSNNSVGYRDSKGTVRTGVEPAQYIKTQRIVEREHYTLTPSACPELRR